jgi:hypothetical protein
LLFPKVILHHLLDPFAGRFLFGDGTVDGNSPRNVPGRQLS